MMSEVISQVSKNARETVFLSLSEFKGHRLIDIRVHVPGDQEGDWVPTRKGVSLAVGLIRPSRKPGRTGGSLG